MNAKDGLHVSVRSIATAMPVADASLRLIARNNEVLHEGNSQRRRKPPHRAGPRLKGEGGAAPALLIARSGEGDYSFIDLTQPAFDLTDRGVDGRAAPAPSMPSSMPSAASTAAARRCTPPCCCATTRPTPCRERR
jgi:alpha-2-macroglobulin